LELHSIQSPSLLSQPAKLHTPLVCIGPLSGWTSLGGLNGRDSLPPFSFMEGRVQSL
jgi:hypothetical protein